MNKSAHYSRSEALSPADPSILLLHAPPGSDRQTCEDFENAIKNTLASKPTLVIVDLSGAQAVSTVIIGMLLNLRRGMAALNGEVRLSGVQPMVRRALNVCRLDQLFHLYSTPQAAMEGGQPMGAV